MHADYRCECARFIEVTFSIKDGPPKDVKCDVCGKSMQRIWKTAIHIPEDFGDDLTTTISQRMQHAARPTGKTKVNF